MYPGSTNDFFWVIKLINLRLFVFTTTAYQGVFVVGEEGFQRGFRNKKLRQFF